jgi:hypothetical protein
VSEVQGVYARAFAAGWEVWVIDYAFEWDKFHGGDRPRDLRLSVLYTVAGQTFVDDNGGRGYALGQNDWALLPAGNVLLNSASFNPEGSDAYVEIFARNVAFQKQIDVVYSTDGWRTVAVAPARWTGSTINFGGPAEVPNPNVHGVERWLTHISQAYLHPGDRLQLALRYSVAGQTYWDNNGGLNYAVDVQDPGVGN